MDRQIFAFRLIGVGFFIGAFILLGILGGVWLDTVWHTRPVFIIVGLFVGLLAAGLGVYHMLLPLVNSKHNKENS
ncbi:AtpZ/AtpI family protein [Chloroflexota bacterium]